MAWHRLLAAIAALTVMLWGLSGILHPIMSVMGPKPAHMQAPKILQQLPDANSETFKAIEKQLHAVNINAFDHVQWVMHGNQVLLQVWPSRIEKPVYLATNSNEVLNHFDTEHAIFLARHFSGIEESTVNHIERVEAFSEDYPSINRLLPVYQVTFDDGPKTHVWVHTGWQSLVSMNTETKRTLQVLFQRIHTLNFIPSQFEWLRLLLMTVMMLSILGMALSGAYVLWMKIKSKRLFAKAAQPKYLRWLHRIAGLCLGVPLMFLAGSGVFHLWAHSGRPEPVRIDVLPNMNLNSWHQHQIAAQHDGKATAIQLAKSWQMITSNTQYKTAKIIDAQLVSRFGDDYDFRNKQLPVWRVGFDGNKPFSVFVEAKTGTILDVVPNSWKYERLSFTQLHKWHVLKHLGFFWQHLITIIVVMLMVILLAGIGAYTRFKTNRPT